MPYLTIGYKRISYTDFKPESGKARETFILHHGLGSSQNFYVPLIPALTKENFRCIVYDATGSGRSPYTQIEQSIASLATDVISILNALRVKKAVMVGHSMGGIVAAHCAAEHGDRVVSSVWIGPVYPGPQVARIIEKRIKIVEKEGMEPLANTLPQMATGSKASPLARAFIRELLLAQDKWGYASNCRVIAGAKPPKYGKINVPVLIIAGEEDKITPLEACKKMFEELGTKQKRLELVEGVGHWHCIEVRLIIYVFFAKFRSDNEDVGIRTGRADDH